MANNTFNIDDYLTPAPSVGNGPEQSQQFQSFNIDDYLDITDKDITGLGKKQAAEFGNQLAKFSHATPVQQYQAFEKYGQQYQNHLAQQGYSPTQIAQALTEFNANADPRNQTGLFEYYIGDRGNDVMIGTGNLIGDALAAVPEAIPVLGQWADNAEKYVKNTTKAWQNDLSAKNQINTYLGEKAYQDKRAEGASEFSATLSSLYENPMQVTSLITQQVPQLLLGAAGTATLAGVNMAGAAGRDRKDIEEAYEKTFKENPEQLLKLPEIQERMAQGMTFEQAVNDAKTDVSDHWKSILASALIGGTEALSPLGKFGQGVNRGVLKTLGKEVGQEALQEGAEQLNSNLAVGEIDGKTGAFDEVVRNATLGAVAGLGTGIPTAIEAGLNGRTESDADIDQILNRSAEGAKNANAQAKAQGESQQANSTNTQSTTGQSSVDEQILESVVSEVADEELRNQYFDELKSSIQDGSIVQAAEQNTAFGRFAKAYMDQAQAKAGVEPQTTQTEKPLQDGKDYVMVSTDVLDMTKIRDITDQNINQVSLEEIEKRAKDELTPREYREAVKILKSRKAEDYDENGELIEKYKAPSQQAVETLQNVVQQTRFQQYVQRLNQAYQTNDNAALEQALSEFSPEEQALFNQEVARIFIEVRPDVGAAIKQGKSLQEINDMIVTPTRYPNHNELSAELSSRKQRVQEIENDPTLDAETKAEQVLYSRSPMKSVEANIKRGREAMNTAIAERRTVHRAMFNHDLDGWVDFEWGDVGRTLPNGKTKGAMGISHIIDKRMNVEGMSYPQVTEFLTKDVVDTVTTGFVTREKSVGNIKSVNIQKGKTIVRLTKKEGNNAWIVTGYNDQSMNQSRGATTSDLRSNSPILSRTDEGATGTDNVQQSTQQRNSQIIQDQQTLSRILGEETASHIQVVDRNTKVPSGRDVKQLATKGVEGWFEPSTQKLYIISDNITANDVLSRDERLAWVAYHELAHAGVRIKYGHLLTNVLASASQNVVVKVLARKIQAEHGYEKEIAIEEAMMEIYAAYETGNWAELESRYKTKIHESYKQGKNNVGDFLTRVANALRRLIGGIIGKDLTQTMTTSQVFETLRGIQQGIHDIAKAEQNQTASEGYRYSFAGEKAQTANHSLLEQAKKAVAQGQNPETVRQETGWFTGADGKWRFEIDDSQAKFNEVSIQENSIDLGNGSYLVIGSSLSDIYEHSNLFGNYPDLRDIPVNLTIDPNIKGKGNAAYTPESKADKTVESIEISAPDLNMAKELLSHEIQHAIQEREDFARGGMVDNTFSNEIKALLETEVSKRLEQGDITGAHDFLALYEKSKSLTPKELYQKLSGEVEARNVQERRNMSFNERKDNSPLLTEDTPRNEQISYTRNLWGGKNIAKYLDEAPNSEFTKAVEAIADGDNPTSAKITLGTTPDVLKMLGIDDTNVIIMTKTLRKDMVGKHKVSPEAMKQLPKQLNDPIAVMQSRPGSTNPKAYLMLTELKEIENGKELPVIAALDFVQHDNGDLELVEISSAYGRKNVKVAKDLLYKPYYWNKTKGNQFLKDFALSAENNELLSTLRTSFSSDDYLSANNVKSEADLRQYQSENSDSNLSEAAYNQAKAEGKTELTFQQWKQVRSPEFKAWFGDWENDPKNASKVINPKTGEPLVVFHYTEEQFHQFDLSKARQSSDIPAFFFTTDPEMGMEYGNNEMQVFLNIRNLVEKPSISSYKDGRALRQELIEQGYDGTIVDDSYEDWLSIEYAALNPNQIKSATDNNGQFSSENDDIRFSLRENPNSEFAKQAEPKRRASSFDEARAIVSEFLGEPLVNKATGMVATVSKRSLEKMVSGKAAKQSSSLHDHLMAVANIDSLFENAVNGWTEQHRTNDPNIAGVQRLFAPLLIDGEMKLAKVTVKAMNFDQGNRIYTVETIEVENENGTLGNLEASIDENQHTSPQSANVKSLIQRIKDFNSSDENSDNIRYSVKQSAMEQAKSGKSIPRETLLDQALSLDMETYKTLFQKGKSKVAEQLADSKMPVIDFINQWKNVKAADKQRIIQALQRAEITRDTERGKLEQVYTKPILEGLVEFTKDSKLDLFTIKRLVGFWISARWSIEKNQMLLEQDRKAMDEAKAIYDSALANSQDSEVIDRADLDYRRAKRQYENRKHDVELDLGSDYSNKAFKVGTAGGWSIPEAKLLMQYIEQRLPVNKMKVLAEKVYDLNQALLKLDNESGRYTDEQLAEYSSHRHYVPLTGDNGDSDIDFIGGVAQKAFNIGKDKRLLGRKNSEAEDAFDAVWKSLGKTTQYYGWADFKHGLAETFDNRVAELKKTGLAEKTAKELASEELGFSKTLQKGSTRTSDDALIFKEDGKYYEMELPPDVAGSLRGDNLESTATPFMRALNWLLTKPTRLMARGVTQLTVDFPIINMVRDIMGKAIYIAHEPMYDANGNEISVSERYKIGFSVYKEAVKSLLNPKDNLFAATFKHAWGAKLNNTGLQADLQELIDNGGFSTFTNNIARSEADFVKQLKTQNSQLRKGLAFLAHLLNTWSGMFDAVSSLATYRALKANGIDAEQAAGLVLETANFNKKGASLTNARGMYMFLQPKMMDAQKMMQILSTKRGVAELTARTVVMSGLYAALGSFWAYVLGDDEDKDEGGYLLDQLGDITGYIPIPLSEGMRNLISEWTGLENIKGNYFKLHLGFGMNQLAWNMAFNLNRAATGSEKWGDALVNIAMNWTKNFAPVTPSEISATSDPLNKLGQTIMPSSVLPLFQVATNKTAFGSSITATNVNSEEVKATQAKPNTAPEWEAASSWILDNLGIDMHPETVKHLVTSYSIMAGSAREYLTVAIENPNRERLGKTQRIPVLNRIFGMPNENSIPNKYYEYSNQIKESTRLYNRYKEIGDVEKMSGLAQEVKFGKILQERYKPISKEKTNLKKQLNEGKLAQQVYDNRMLIIRRKEEAMQRQAVRMLRQSEGLTTN